MEGGEATTEGTFSKQPRSCLSQFLGHALKSWFRFAQINLMNPMAFKRKYHNIKPYGAVTWSNLQKVCHFFNMCLTLDSNQTPWTLHVAGMNCSLPCKLSQQIWNALLTWTSNSTGKDSKDRTDKKITDILYIYTKKCTYIRKMSQQSQAWVTYFTLQMEGEHSDLL